MRRNKMTREEAIELAKTYVPEHSDDIGWEVDDNELVVISMENKGLMNRIAQKLFRKPRISYIHLDELGSFVWQCINGTDDVGAIGVKVKEHFGEEADPVYERLAAYMTTLGNTGFIHFI
ncbi:MAG: PqqD family protein [Anaerovoracaceae bacterium]|jgi:hypothetical protein